jgi:hypothetical protein
MIYTGSGDLPRHLYVYVDRSFIRRDGTGFEPAVWFGLTAKFGEMWGANLMLECGAIYRNVPLHALAFRPNPDPDWSEQSAQAWDCYGAQFSVIEYRYLTNVQAEIRKPAKLMGSYLFTAIPLFDGYTRHPGQSKEFVFLELENGRLSCKSTDMLIFHDKSFCTPSWPTDLRRQVDTYHCEMSAVADIVGKRIEG